MCDYKHRILTRKQAIRRFRRWKLMYPYNTFSKDALVGGYRISFTLYSLTKRKDINKWYHEYKACPVTVDNTIKLIAKASFCCKPIVEVDGVIKSLFQLVRESSHKPESLSGWYSRAGNHRNGGKYYGSLRRLREIKQQYPDVYKATIVALTLKSQDDIWVQAILGTLGA